MYGILFICKFIFWLDPPQAGWYQCTAYNTAGSCATRARVVVDQPPQQQLSSQDGGQPARLHFPQPTRIIEPE